MSPAKISINELAAQLNVGDLVFIRIPAVPFTKVARVTSSWTNHVGIVIDLSRSEPVIAESKFPLSGRTKLSRYIGRSEAGRIAVIRLNSVITRNQCEKMEAAVQKRIGILYDTGFNLRSPRQFCSRFVHEVLDEAMGIKVGEIEDFSTLLARNPRADIAFCRLWYFGRIPWQRETVTPASLLRSSSVHPVFDGFVSKDD